MCFSDTDSESDSDGEELHLNFMALICEEGDPRLDSVVEEDDDDQEMLSLKRAMTE